MSSVGFSDPGRASASRRGRPALRVRSIRMQGNEHRVGGDERVQCQQPETRRAVDEDAVERLRSGRANRRRRDSRRQANQFDLGAGELAVGRDTKSGRLRSAESGVGVDRPALVSAS